MTKKITLVMTEYEAECFVAAAGEAMDHSDVVEQTLMHRKRAIRAASMVWGRLKRLRYACKYGDLMTDDNLMTGDTYIPTDADRQIQAMILRRMPAESKAWHAFQDSGQWRGDVPRDVFQRVFEEDGHAEALRLCLHPERPFKGVPLFDQPCDRMDAWERFLAANRKA